MSHSEGLWLTPFRPSVRPFTILMGKVGPLCPSRPSVLRPWCLVRAVPKHRLPGQLSFLAVVTRRLVDLGPVRERAASEVF